MSGVGSNFNAAFFTSNDYHQAQAQAQATHEKHAILYPKEDSSHLSLSKQQSNPKPFKFEEAPASIPSLGDNLPRGSSRGFGGSYGGSNVPRGGYGGYNDPHSYGMQQQRPHMAYMHNHMPQPHVQPYMPQPYMQQPYALPYMQHPYAQPPYAQQPHVQQPHVQQPRVQQVPAPIPTPSLAPASHIVQDNYQHGHNEPTVASIGGTSPRPSATPPEAMSGIGTHGDASNRRGRDGRSNISQQQGIRLSTAGQPTRVQKPIRNQASKSGMSEAKLINALRRDRDAEQGHE